MSRFSGWTAGAVERLTGEKIVKSTVKYDKKYSKNIPDYTGMIVAALKLLGIESQREYKFLHDRRFRFDLVILPISKMIAIEWEGGIHSGGRHVRGKGYANDAKKYNLAVRHGWKLLRFTTEDTKKLNWEFQIADEIKNLIEGGSNAR